tara:strand:+ start:415 stop:819 length:405 start_codon:yes stop_codon:yes gene_type:complete
MKKNELKQILKPLIKECIKECIFEEGVLSGIVTEVAKGMATQRLVAEGITVTKKTADPEDLKKKADALEAQRQKKIKMLNESMSFGEVNVFEGTKTIPADTSGQNALSGVSSDDKGVDIDGIMAIASGKWKQLM